MELNQWLSPEFRQFLIIAEAGSLSGAARKSGHDVGNLSRTLNKLESSIGASLFVRHQTGLTLTARGRELVAALQNGAKAFQGSFRSEVSETIRVGFSPAVGFGFFGQHFLPSLSKLKLIPEFTLAPSIELYKLLKDRQIDFILSPRLPKFPDIVSAALFETRLALCSRHGNFTRKLIHSQHFFELEKRLKGIPFDETVIVDDTFVAAKLLTESDDYMGIIPECILENFPSLKILDHKFEDEKVHAITWRGSVGMNVLKEVRAALRKS